MENESKTNGIVKKLNKIYKMGYMPSRGKMVYTFESANMVNCFGHACFNLDDKNLEKFKSVKDDLKDFFTKFSTEGNTRNFYERAKEKVSQVGLGFAKSDLKEKLQNNQWKVAYYIMNDVFRGRDVHFMIQEKDGTWTSKLGTKSELEIFDVPPQTYRYDYELVGIYKIKNPYIKVKDEGMER